MFKFSQTACLPRRKLQLSPLIRLSGYKSHVFKWGIGTEHSLRNKLRVLPPTVPHPKEQTITDDYFSQPCENIKFQFQTMMTNVLPC